MNETNPRTAMLCLDLETTGVDPTVDRIVTASVVRLRGDGSFSTINWMADPGVEIPEVAVNVHGVTTEQARAEGRPTADVLREVYAEVRLAYQMGVPVAGYNLSYDLTMLTYEGMRHEVVAPRFEVVLDALVIDRAMDRYRKGQRTLTAACEHYGVVLENAHSADADALASGLLLHKLFDKYPRLDMPLRDLHDKQVIWRWKQCESLQEYLRKENPDAVVDGRWPIAA